MTVFPKLAGIFTGFSESDKSLKLYNWAQLERDPSLDLNQCEKFVHGTVVAMLVWNHTPRVAMVNGSHIRYPFAVP